MPALLLVALGALAIFALFGVMLGRSTRRTAHDSHGGYDAAGDGPVMFFDGGSGGSDCDPGDAGCGDGGGDGGGGDGGGGGD